MMLAAIDAQTELAYSGAIIWRAAAMKPTPTRLNFTQMLVWNAVVARSVSGVATVTDRLVGLECALSPATVRDTRKSLVVAGLLDDARVIARGRVEADDEYQIVIREGAMAS